MKPLTFPLAEEWDADMAFRRMSPKTRKAYPIDVQDFFDFTKAEPELVKKAQVKDWLGSLSRRKLAPRTICRRHASLSSYFAFRRDHDEDFKNNPCEGIVLPKAVQGTPDHLTLDEAKRLVEFRPATFMDERAHLFIVILYSVALRMAEAVDLNVGDIDLTTGVVSVRHGKGDKPREVLMAPSAIREVKWWLTKYPKDSDAPLFHNRCGERITANGLRGDLKRVVRALGIKRRVWAHLLRHSIATHLADAGVDLSFIQNLLGHASPATTKMFYAAGTLKQQAILVQKHPMNEMAVAK